MDALFASLQYRAFRGELEETKRNEVEMKLEMRRVAIPGI